jgi:hypothetical protein
MITLFLIQKIPAAEINRMIKRMNSFIYPHPTSSSVISPLDDVITILTNRGTPGVVQYVEVDPWMVAVYFIAAGYVPAGTVTGSIPANVYCTVLSVFGLAGTLLVSVGGISWSRTVCPFETIFMCPPRETPEATYMSVTVVAAIGVVIVDVILVWVAA